MRARQRAAMGLRPPAPATRSFGRGWGLAGVPSCGSARLCVAVVGPDEVLVSRSPARARS